MTQGNGLPASAEVTDNRAVLKIGQIVQLQVQRSGLKLPSLPGAANGRYYDPAPLLPVARLTLTAAGVVGVVDEGEPIVDVHHQHHPTTKYDAKYGNAMSVGFTTHYARMRERFGPHLTDGIAGENVLVAADEQIEPERLLAGLDITLADGRQVHLEQVVVAEPCIEFTRYALRLDAAQPGGEACTNGLRFLRFGMRGFYVTYIGEPVVLNLGDVISATA
jgi:hypothetical protein